jgi:hypothetical protein
MLLLSACLQFLDKTIPSHCSIEIAVQDHYRHYERFLLSGEPLSQSFAASRNQLNCFLTIHFPNLRVISTRLRDSSTTKLILSVERYSSPAYHSSVLEFRSSISVSTNTENNFVPNRLSPNSLIALDYSSIKSPIVGI